VKLAKKDADTKPAPKVFYKHNHLHEGLLTFWKEGNHHQDCRLQGRPSEGRCPQARSSQEDRRHHQEDREAGC
jgi:hypothetical protein